MEELFHRDIRAFAKALAEDPRNLAHFYIPATLLRWTEALVSAFCNFESNDPALVHIAVALHKLRGQVTFSFSFFFFQNLNFG